MNIEDTSKIRQEMREIELNILPSMMDTCIEVASEISTEYRLNSYSSNFNHIYWYSPFPIHHDATRYIELLLLFNNVFCKIGEKNGLFIIDTYYNI